MKREKMRPDDMNLLQKLKNSVDPVAAKAIDKKEVPLTTHKETVEALKKWYQVEETYAKRNALGAGGATVGAPAAPSKAGAPAPGGGGGVSADKIAKGYCTHCKLYGHLIGDCRKLQKEHAKVLKQQQQELQQQQQQQHQQTQQPQLQQTQQQQPPGVVGGAKPDIICNKCKGKGHKAAQCPGIGSEASGWKPWDHYKGCKECGGNNHSKVHHQQAQNLAIPVKNGKAIPPPNTSHLVAAQMQPAVDMGGDGNFDPSKRDCTFWTKGRCTRGTKCIFKHDPAKGKPTQQQGATGVDHPQQAGAVPQGAAVLFGMDGKPIIQCPQYLIQNISKLQTEELKQLVDFAKMKLPSAKAPTSGYTWWFVAECCGLELTIKVSLDTGAMAVTISRKAASKIINKQDEMHKAGKQVTVSLGDLRRLDEPQRFVGFIFKSDDDGFLVDVMGILRLWVR